MSHIDLTGVNADHLSPGQIEVLQDFMQILEPKDSTLYSRDPKYGLWICGTRGYGSTYIGKVMVKTLRKRYGRDFTGISALKLVQSIRGSWTSAAMVRQHPDDYGLLMEMYNTERDLDYLFEEAPVVWIDDLHQEPIDVAFWRKHVHFRLEERVKDRLLTIVSTDMSPNHPELMGLEEPIQRLFHICVADYTPS